jgi:hypothetical protein
MPPPVPTLPVLTRRRRPRPRTAPPRPPANVEEARVLYEKGWTYLDIRSEFELDESGKVGGFLGCEVWV